ncbi:hypothetical protein [Prevotella jejuni]|uniref:hypothetical protein n=1 Tax=Prevotella jejuni TaxID=1177574 RepID=UPI001C5FAC80|nr:hypothetical protein [Prevotella jejuni]MBW4772786.1 hypothetical protein [Prevotella jejuni]
MTERTEKTNDKEKPLPKPTVTDRREVKVRDKTEHYYYQRKKKIEGIKAGLIDISYPLIKLFII